jgi:hypothetical protein
MQRSLISTSLVLRPYRGIPFKLWRETIIDASPIQTLLEESVSEETIKIFYSYSRKDLDMRNTLEAHLSALR